MTRYYDPQIGRFINADTPDYLDPKTINGLNLYSYCNSNPIMNVDPRGTVWYYVLALVTLIAVSYVVTKAIPVVVKGIKQAINAILNGVNIAFQRLFDGVSTDDVGNMMEATMRGAAKPYIYNGPDSYLDDLVVTWN